MLKNYFTLFLLILLVPLSYGQIQPVSIKITDNIAKAVVDTNSAKRSILKPSASEMLEAGINLSDLPAGLYLLSIQNYKPQVFVKQ